MKTRIPAATAVSIGSLLVLALGGAGCGKSPEKPGSAAVEATPPASPARPARVVLEVDRMEGTPRIETTMTVGGTAVSLKQIYKNAGIDLDVILDQENLPRVGQLRLADLHNLMTSFDTLPLVAGVGKIHALVVTADAEDPDTLGIMFDFDSADLNLMPREGFAVFAKPHETLANPAAELLLTTAHEMAHCFNLHHPDWEGTGFKTGSTVEGYSMSNTVKWALSERSKRHIREHQLTEVWPGRGGLPFGSVAARHLGDHESAPAESFSVVDAGSSARGITRSGDARRSGLGRDAARMLSVEADPLKLRLEAPKTSFVIGEPVTLTVGLHNEGSADRYVLPLLDPRYQFLNVEIRKKGTEEFVPFRSAVLADARGVPAARLKPGDSLHDEIKIFFGAKGWTFKEPGTFEIRADYPVAGLEPGAAGEREGHIQSGVLELEIIQAPTASTSRRATDLILGDGRYEQGLFLFLDGADHLKGAKARLQGLLEAAPNSVQAPAVRLALAQAVLNPSPRPGSRVAAEVDVAQAQEYLRELPTEGLPPLSVARAAKQLEKRGETTGARVLERRLERSEGVRHVIRSERLRAVQPH